MNKGFADPLKHIAEKGVRGKDCVNVGMLLDNVVSLFPTIHLCTGYIFGYTGVLFVYTSSLLKRSAYAGEHTRRCG
jgi:hypothetical protein